MKNCVFLLAALLVGSTLSAQNSNDQAPKSGHTLGFSTGATIAVSYRSFTVDKGTTLRGLSGGKFESADFYNNVYIPMMLDGRIQLNTAGTLGGTELKAGKYRFSFRIDAQGAWNMDLFSDTGKKTIGTQKWQPKKGWWAQETKVASLKLKTTDTGDDSASRLSIVPVAAISRSKSHGNLAIRFGPFLSSVAYKLAAPAQPVDASGKDKK